jgi:hypothetical protein
VCGSADVVLPWRCAAAGGGRGGEAEGDEVEEGEAMTAVEELEQLQARRATLAAEIADVESRATFMSREVTEARANLVQAERLRTSGQGSAQAVAAAQKKLADVSSKAATDTTPEKLLGMRAALSDLTRELSGFAEAHWAELRDERNQRAEQAAARVDQACRELVTAVMERETVAAQSAQVFGLVGRTTPTTVPTTLADAVVREANVLLDRGGERPPVLPESYTPVMVQEPTLVDALTPNDALVPMPPDAVGGARWRG